MQYLSRPCTAVSHNSHTVRESLVLSKNSSPDMLRMIIQEGQLIVHVDEVQVLGFTAVCVLLCNPQGGELVKVVITPVLLMHRNWLRK